MCVSIRLSERGADAEDIETLGDLIREFGADRLVWIEGYAPNAQELGDADKACFCGLDMHETAAGLGYAVTSNPQGDPMCAIWTKAVQQ